MKTIKLEPLTAEHFAPFGQMISADGTDFLEINRGNCHRYDDLGQVEIAGTDARVKISVFKAQPYTLPLTLDMMERHPFGSQAFLPFGRQNYIVIVASDDNGVPVDIRAFVPPYHCGVNLKPNVWHGVLTPVEQAGEFWVVDRAGAEGNLVEFYFEEPFTIEM